MAHSSLTLGVDPPSRRWMHRPTTLSHWTSTHLFHDRVVATTAVLPDVATYDRPPRGCAARADPRVWNSWLRRGLAFHNFPRPLVPEPGIEGHPDLQGRSSVD